MGKSNIDLFENVKQCEDKQDNNNDSPRSVKSNCSSNGKIGQKIKHLKHN